MYITRRDGGCPTRTEVSSLLSKFGDLEAIVYPTETDRYMHDLQPGAWARFRIFGDCKDALNVQFIVSNRRNYADRFQDLQHNMTYFVRQAKELNANPQVFLNEGPHGPPKVNDNRVRGVRIHGLSRDAKTTQIRERFKLHGKIQSLNVRPSHEGAGHDIEALVVYAHWKDAERAVIQEACIS